MPDEKERTQIIQNLEADKVKFAAADIDGVLRGNIISKAKLLKDLEEGLGPCNVMFNSPDLAETTVGNNNTNRPVY